MPANAPTPEPERATVIEIEAIRQAVVAVAEQSDTGIQGVLLIGSCARREQCANSDIDLIVMIIDRLDRPSLTDRFRASFSAHDLPPKPDPVTVDQQGNILSVNYEARWMRFLDVDHGYKVLYGRDFRGLLQVPPPSTVLQICLNELQSVLTNPRLDAREVLMAALGEHFARTGKWPTKQRLGTSSQYPIVRQAWAVHCPDPASPQPAPLDTDACRDFLVQAKQTLQDALDTDSEVAP